MHIRLTAALIAATLIVAAPHAQAPAPRDFKIIRLDPALDEIVAPDARLETLGEHFGLTEGPVWVNDPAGGYLAFSDLTANVIYKRTTTAASRCSPKTSTTAPTSSTSVNRRAVAAWP